MVSDRYVYASQRYMRPEPKTVSPSKNVDENGKMYVDLSVSLSASRYPKTIISSCLLLMKLAT